MANKINTLQPLGATVECDRCGNELKYRMETLKYSKGSKVILVVEPCKTCLFEAECGYTNGKW